MSPAITVSIHFWRGVGPDIQRDLFFKRFRFGFLTLSIDRADVFGAYQKLRSAIVERISNAPVL